MSKARGHITDICTTATKVCKSHSISDSFALNLVAKNGKMGFYKAGFCMTLHRIEFTIANNNEKQKLCYNCTVFTARARVSVR